ncbi:DUF692 domain-containing protein [Lusitaniella coriacea]|uniref:DUF692 domain-containing protein n=1 Tax=Lusitaniella coriacea TaxID=1983105 RepID=UPI003CEE2FD3
MFSELPSLGVGIGFREPLRSEIFLQRNRVDFLEIIAECYLDVTDRKERELDLLAAHFPLIPHGINLSIGSAQGVDSDYLGKFAALIRRINPPWWSEHLCFTQAGGIDIGHLSPLPYTREAVNVVCRNIDRVRRAIDCPLLLENIAYLVTVPGAEMSEAQFIAEIAERSDCGLLLDVTNLYTNGVNHNYGVEGFLSEFPLERVVQLHFAGGYWQDGVLIDSHSHATFPEVWQLMEKVVAQACLKGIVLERDENLPPFEELATELERARALGRQYQKWD